MIVFLTVTYVALLAILVWRKVLPNSKATWLSTIVWVVLLLLVLWFPMQWGAPGGPVRVMTYTVPIVPNVSGVVTEVPVEPDTPIKKGDVLFRIDDTPFRATVESIRAQLKFWELRQAQYRKLARLDAATRFRVEEAEARVRRYKADLKKARWNLDQTTVRAPADGFITYLALRPGSRVVILPFVQAMTFVDTSANIVGAQIDQIYLRNVRAGQPVELTFKTQPGKVYTGKVHSILRVTAEGQLLPSGTVARPNQMAALPFFVRITLDDKSVLKELPPGSVGTAAIYTSHVKMTHVIRKVVLRLDSIMNYIVPSM